MTTSNITIEQLAENMGKTVWSKGDLKRIYLNGVGYNTKKMSTKVFIYEKDGEFRVSVNIDCPSQPYQWIESQEAELRESILKDIEYRIFSINNPDVDYTEYQEQLVAEKEAKEIEAEQMKLSEKEKEIAELTIDNVSVYLFKQPFIEQSRNPLLWDVKYHNAQLKIQSGFLNKNDEYPPRICDYMFERIFLKSERHANEFFSEPIGKIQVGNTVMEFEDVVEFVHVRTQGKNGPNKKNVFRPVSIPQHVTDALNAQLEVEKSKRIEHLKQQVAYHMEELIKAIEAYKYKMLPR